MSANRLRRRLLVFSAPIAGLLVLVILKLASAGMAGRSAAHDFAARDRDALRGDVSALNVVNVIEPAKALFAGGASAVLDGRLHDADEQFSRALAHTDREQACPVLVNLELVRETLGDNAAGVFDTTTALARYLDALKVVEEAPPGCFANNTDSDEQRRAVRDDAASRLNDKIAAARAARPPPPPQAPVPAVPPPAPSPAGSDSADQFTELHLDPGSGDPLEKLRQILRDAAAARANQRGGS
jgi:hypothetical protein